MMEPNDPSLEAVHAYVERAYLRLQAGDVLIRCMDEGSTIPMQRVVEELVLAGPQSLAILREILAESSQRKNQVHDDMHQVYVQFISSLESYGVRLSGHGTALSVTRLTPGRFLDILRKQNIAEDATHVSCLQLLHETRSLIKHLSVQLKLLEEVEQYLQDWMLAMVYDAAHTRRTPHEKPPARGRHH